MIEKTCHYCGIGVGDFPLNTGRTLCGDHVKPKSKGGANKPHNIVIACNVCNSIKGNRTIDEARFRLVQKMIGWPRFTLAQIEWLRSRGFDLSEYDRAKLAFERLNN